MKREGVLDAGDVFETAAGWRMRAEGMRTIADETRDATARAMIFRIAADYDRLAKQASLVVTPNPLGIWTLAPPAESTAAKKEHAPQQASGAGRGPNSQTTGAPSNFRSTSPHGSVATSLLERLPATHLEPQSVPTSISEIETSGG